MEVMKFIGYVAAFAPIVAGFIVLMVMAMPEKITSEGSEDGQHRQTSAPLYSGSPYISSISARGSGALSASEAASEVARAINTGYFSAKNAGAYYSYLMRGGRPVTHHSLSPMPALGSGYSSAHQHALAQAASQARLQMQANAMGNVGALYPGMLHRIGMNPNPPPHSPTTLKPEGIRAGEIIAWRAWNLSGDVLMSVVADGKTWSESEPMQGDAAAGYGVHAYKGPHGPLLDNYVSKDSSIPWVIGEVALWGDIIEHEEGYRAEFARVHSLVTWSDLVQPGQRDALRRRYLVKRDLKIDDAA